MADRRISTYNDMAQTEFRDSFDLAPIAPTPLRAMAKTLEITPGGNTFREFITSFYRGTSSTLTATRALEANNPLTTNGSYFGMIASTAETVGYLDHTIEDSFSFARPIEMTAGVDTLYNTPERLAQRTRSQFDMAHQQWAHEKCLAQAIFANEWIVDPIYTGKIETAITAGATTFDITDAFKASSGIKAGDLVKIAAKRRPGSASGAVEVQDVVIVKTVGADGSAGGVLSTITIENVAANFPHSDSFDGTGIVGNAFEKLSTALHAHADNTRIQLDRPWSVDVSSVDPILSKIRTQKNRTNVMSSDFVLYMTPEVDEVLFGTNASGVRTPVVANDFLGKDVLFNGTLDKYRGMVLMADSNALSRSGGISDAALTVADHLGTTRHYIFAFVKGEAFGFGEPLKGGGTFEDIVGTDKKLKYFSFYEVSGAVTLYEGSLKMFLIPVVVA